LADPGDLSTDDIQEFVVLSSANDKRRREAEITRKKALLAATSMMSVRFNAWYIPLLICLLLGSLALRMWDPPAIQVLRNTAFDTYQLLDPQTGENTPVRIVDIDSESLARIGQWPWPRTTMSDIILALRQARVIGLTVLFSEPDRYSLEEFFKSLPPGQVEEIRKVFGTKMTNDRVLAEAMRKANNVVLSLFPSRQASTFDYEGPGWAKSGSGQDNVQNYVVRFPGVVPNLPILQSAGR